MNETGTGCPHCLLVAPLPGPRLAVLTALTAATAVTTARHNPATRRRVRQAFSATRYCAGALATVLASLLMVWLCYASCTICLSCTGHCGTPIAAAMLNLMVAPLFLILPWLKWFFMQPKDFCGLLARCSLTCAVAVWLATMLFCYSFGFL